MKKRLIPEYRYTKATFATNFFVQASHCSSIKYSKRCQRRLVVKNTGGPLPPPPASGTTVNHHHRLIAFIDFKY